MRKIIAAAASRRLQHESSGEPLGAQGAELTSPATKTRPQWKQPALSHFVKSPTTGREGLASEAKDQSGASDSKVMPAAVRALSDNGSRGNAGSRPVDGMRAAGFGGSKAESDQGDALEKTVEDVDAHDEGADACKGITDVAEGGTAGRTQCPMCGMALSFLSNVDVNAHIDSCLGLTIEEDVIYLD